MNNISKFLLKSMMKAARSDVSKTRRAVLRGLDRAQITKDLLATLDRASASWTAAPQSGSNARSERGNAQAQPNTEADSATKDVGVANNFSEQHFKFGADTYRYRVFTPTRTDNSALPMLVMLHGCKQDALDFSKGIEMNSLAEREKFIVLYPEQLRKSNQSNCWNWFSPAHQSRGAGEPAMISSLTLSVAKDFNVDPHRIYVAGLSAGGAMAALVGKLYPEIFAAVGIHSGLAPNSARDVITAFQAMAKGPTSAAAVSIGRPTIVFQGTADPTVAAANAKSIVSAELEQLNATKIELTEQSLSIDRGTRQRSATVKSWSNGDGLRMLEVWMIDGAGHAWSGGSDAGSYTDPAGPFATVELFRFFKDHRNHR